MPSTENEANSILRGNTDEWPYDSTLIAELDGLRAVVAVYRNAQIVSREFDEGDDEMEEAWRAAWLAHLSFDPTLAICRDGCGHPYA